MNSTKDPLVWLASYNRDTGSLSTVAATGCGYGDMVRAGYVVNRGPMEMPDLFITDAGRAAVRIHSQGIGPRGVVGELTKTER